jgi:cyclopropane-fatty-acyl-phospholipid synthase
VQDTAALLAAVLGPIEAWRVRVKLWEGTVLGPASSPGAIVLKHPWSLRAMLWPPGEVSAGEAYIFGDVDAEGDLESIFDALSPVLDLEWRQPRRFAQLMRLLLRLPSPPQLAEKPHAASTSGIEHSRTRDRQAVRHHYDVSGDFYKLWLDGRMQYSCGYFEHDGADLESAQTAKVAHICRKLRLEHGHQLLDIGCGWGGLLEYAATHFGASGLGVTLSEPQAAEANARFERAGVSDRVRAQVIDYRDVEGEFDAIASIGMVEHVGAVNLPQYFERAFQLLKPGGVFLNHGIVSAWSDRPSPPKDSFIGKYVFPDGELVPISAMLAEAEKQGFEVRDVENLREHYAKTLRHWVGRLQERAQHAVESTDEITYRIWLLYMSGSAYNFERGNIGVCQSLLHRPTGGHSGLPPTRHDWYGVEVG